MEAEAECPYCAEPITLWIDEGGGGAQCYIEDCSVCCRPFEVHATADEDWEFFVSLRRLDE